MKTFWTVFILLALSSQAMSQVEYFEGVLGDGSGFLGLRNKEERRIHACENFLDSILEDIGVHSDNSKYCKDKASSEKITGQKKRLNQCMKEAYKVTQIGTDLLKYCLDEKFDYDLKDPKFTDCLEESKKLGFGLHDHARIHVCRAKDSRELIHDTNFLSCLEFMKFQKPGQGISTRIKQCLNPGVIEAINGPGFIDCRTKVTGLGFAPVVTINYCFLKENQNEIKISQVESCTKTMDRLLGQGSGLKYCLDFKDAARLQDPKILSCFEKTNRSLVPGYFVRDEDNSKSIAKFQEILTDCNMGPKPGRAPGLKLHAAFYFNASERFDYSQVGGLSGITYDAKSDLFHVVSDDPGFRGPSRFFSMQGFFNDGAQFILKSKTFLNTTSTDAEGIQMLDNGNFAISSETLISGSKSLIKIYDSKGKQKDEIPMSKKYKRSTEFVEVGPPRKDGYQQSRENAVRGMQDNLGLESLGIPENNKNVIFTAPEAPLIQDMIPDQRIVRIVKISKNEKGDFENEQEFAYEMENHTENGISDILPLDEHRLLVLERRYDYKMNKVYASIYEVNLRNGVEVTEISSLKEQLKSGKAIPVLKKKLVVKLEDIVSSLPAGFRRLENVEGMVLGTKLPNGHRALVIVTDNNFNDKQMNQILVLEYPF